MNGEELTYRQYPVAIEVSRTSKGLYSWVIKCRADLDDKETERWNADKEAFERAVKLDEMLSNKFEAKDEDNARSSE